MREIKFRVWNKEWKMFAVAITDIYFDIETHLPYGIEFEHQTTDGQWHCDSWMENCEFQQFTGLQDKNGKDIYEGDIVKLLTHYPQDFQERNPYKKHGRIGNGVSWDNKMCCYLLDNTPGLEPTFCGFDNNEQWEIIGNIYENPELLTN